MDHLIGWFVDDRHSIVNRNSSFLSYCFSITQQPVSSLRPWLMTVNLTVLVIGFCGIVVNTVRQPPPA
jgi:hypothetical protein